MSDLTPRQPHDADGEPTAVVHTESATTSEKPESAPVSAVAGSTPDGPEPTTTRPEAEPAAAASPAVATVPVRERWHRRRVPMLAAAGALLIGGLIGGGAVAIGAVAFDGHRGDGHRGEAHGPRSGRDGGGPAEGRDDRVPHGPRFGRDGGPAEGRGSDRFGQRGGAGQEQRHRGRDGSTPAPSGSAVPSSPAPSVSS